MTVNKIVFVYRALSKGGTGSVIFNRMGELLRRGIDVRSFYFQDHGGMEDSFRSRVMVSQDEDEISACLQEFRPDWVLHFDAPELVKKIPEWVPGVNQAYEVHTTYEKNYEPLKDREMLNKIQGLLVPSAYQAEVVTKKVSGLDIPVEIVPNGLREQFFDPQKERERIKGPTIVWVGRLEAHKNWLVFLEVAKQIAQRSPTAQFWMVGGSHATEEQQQILWQKIVKYHLIHRFRWFPDVPSERMPILLQSVSESGGCILSTSRGESFGIAVLEAMSCGCPAVVPDVGGLKELVKPGVNGFIFSRRNHKEAVNQLTRIIEDRNLFQSMSSQAKSAAQQYTPQHIIDHLLQVLDQWNGKRSRFERA
jgi:glycosyltransferase involved in cell wall biosynthesis